MSDGPQSPGQPEPGQPEPGQPQPAPAQPAWPDPPTRPQTWPELPTVPIQQGPPAWPQQPPQPWPQHQAPAAPPAWPQEQAPPRPQPPAGPGRERYAVRPSPEQYGQEQYGQEQYGQQHAPAQYGQQYAPAQQPQEWAPLPLHAQEMRPVAVAPKSPALSVLLSVFIPGLGSMVNDNAGIGVTILVLNIIGWMLAIVLIGIPLAIGTWIWGLVDAHQSAQRWNRAHGIIS